MDFMGSSNLGPTLGSDPESLEVYGYYKRVLFGVVRDAN